MSARKKAKKEKPVAKKPAVVPAVSETFNLLDDGVDWAAEAGKGLRAAIGRRKGREIRLSSQEEVSNKCLPLRSLAFQWALDNIGLPPCVVNFMGKSGVGKTTLLYNLFGLFMTRNHPCAILVGDGKKLNTDWAQRALWPETGLSRMMVKKLLVDDMAQLDQMWEMLRELCALFRNSGSKLYVPRHIPIIVAVDIINKMATRAQAAGIMSYGGLDREAEVEHGDRGHKMDRSSWYHDMAAALRALQYEHNVLPFFVEHQNQANAMGGKGGKATMFSSQYDVDKNNMTRPGGEAINQVAGLQLTVVPRGTFYSGGAAVGHRVALTVVKNSFGPRGRACCFGLKTEGFSDTGEWMEPCVRWDWGEIAWLTENRLLGMRQSGDQYNDLRYTCEELGFAQASLTDAAEAWEAQRDSRIDELGAAMRISGYLRVKEKVLGADAPPSPE